MKSEYLRTAGLVADIQRFSVHDGPGIRTVIFLKGCNLRCAWCHNPETIHPNPEYLLKPEHCIGCGKCEEGCFSGARVLCGTEMTVEEVLHEVLMEKPYFGNDGGVTISGGEPGCQPEFALALLQACREAGIHTAVETNMTLPERILAPVWQAADLILADLILADLKLWDEEAHIKWTGISNVRIRENILACSCSGRQIILHTPVIKGINDNEEEITAIARFAGGLSSLRFYELLPYHPLGLSKGRSEHFEPMKFSAPDKERLEELARIGLSFGIPVRISGRKITAGK